MVEENATKCSYFPHDCDASDDEKILALESLHQNNGYAVYFKLLERLYRSSDGALDVSDPLKKQVLADKTHVTIELFERIMADATNLDLFDKKQYYNDHKIISSGVTKRRLFINDNKVKNRERVKAWRQRTKLTKLQEMVKA